MTDVTVQETGKQNSRTRMEEARGNTNATHRILRTHTPKKVISVGRRDSPNPRSAAKNTPLGTYKI